MNLGTFRLSQNFFLTLSFLSLSLSLLLMFPASRLNNLQRCLLRERSISDFFPFPQSLEENNSSTRDGFVCVYGSEPPPHILLGSSAKVDVCVCVFVVFSFKSPSRFRMYDSCTVCLCVPSARIISPFIQSKVDVVKKVTEDGLKMCKMLTIKLSFFSSPL